VRRPQRRIWSVVAIVGGIALGVASQRIETGKTSDFLATFALFAVVGGFALLFQSGKSSDSED
jgi:ribose/xylose/arabinose/galactoside ABC-type transport system permease subunit